MPLTKVTAMNTTPISADAPATRSTPGTRPRATSTHTEQMAVTMNARYASHTDGTWTYMMRTASPWATSAGDSTRPNRVSHADITMAAMPITRVARVPVLRGVVGVVMSCTSLSP